MQEKLTKKNIALFMLITAGLVVAIYLVQTQQILRSKAFSNPGQALEIRSNDPAKEVNYDGDSNTFKTNSKSVNIRLRPETLESLKQVN